MAERNGDYQEIIAEIALGRDSKDSPKAKVRPRPSQGLATSLNVECARQLCEMSPIGTQHRIRVKQSGLRLARSKSRPAEAIVS